MATFTGTAGDDSLVGTAQNDEFLFSTGNDTLIGGEGFDQIFADDFYGTGLPSGTVVDFGAGSIVGTGVNHSVSGIEGIFVEEGDNITLRGGEGADSLNLTITDGTSLIEGRGGNDSMVMEGLSTGTAYGGDGDDTFYIIGTGNATVEGGSGDDTLVFEGYGSSPDVQTNRAGHYVLTFGNGSITLLDEIEQITTYDNAGNETTISLADFLPAMLSGTAGDDSLVGTDGNDTFFFSLGDDTLIGGAGVDLLSANLPEGSLIDLAAGTITTLFSNQSISGIENLEVFGSGNATLRGDGGDNNLYLQGEGGVIEGGAGNDTLETEDISGLMSGGDGDDVFFVAGRGVSATVEGGSGADRLDFSARADDITVSTNAAGQRVLSWQTQTVTLLDEVENFVFIDGTTVSYADMIPAPSITGTNVGEVLTGTARKEQIDALGGNDWITTGGGADTIDGGDGIDMVSYADLGTLGISATLFSGQAPLQGGRQSLTNVENLTGSSGQDTLTGDDADNLLRGLGGRDIFFTSGGADRMDGGAGADLLRAGDFFESIDNDVSASLLRGRIWEGEGTGTRLSNIEHIRSGGGNDMLTGDHGINRLEGNYGNDTLMGNGGDDLIYGGFGDDVALYSKAQDQYEVTQNGEVTQVAYIGVGVGDGTDLLLNIEVLRFADGDLVF